MNAQQAISQSVAQNEIVTLDWSAAAIVALQAECDDSADADAAHEFWGVDLDGGEWRVHVARADDDALLALAQEADAAGDEDQSDLCGRALRGDRGARAKCERAMIDAAAQAD